MTDQTLPAIHRFRSMRVQRFAAIALCCVGFVMFYVISMGPMAALHEVYNFPPFQTALEIVYAPLIFIVEARIEPFSTILRIYIDIFR